MRPLDQELEVPESDEDHIAPLPTGSQFLRNNTANVGDVFWERSNLLSLGTLA